MSEMVERVAKAIMAAENPDSADQYTEMARAAIAAMREPTVEMLVAAYAVVGVPRNPVLANGYRAMIDEALSDRTRDGE